MLTDPLDVIKTIGTVKPNGVIHVGGGLGEESEQYIRHGIKRQVWIEPQEVSFKKIKERIAGNPEATAVQVACGAERTSAFMYRLRGNEGRSNSLLKPFLHLVYHPEMVIDGNVEVVVDRLDSVILNLDPKWHGINFMVIDVQGYELQVLHGVGKLITDLSYAALEVNKEELYKGCARVEDIDAFMESHYMKRTFTHWAGPQGSYGDALYVRQ